MIVIIIAAGFANRMRPLTMTRLKGSLPIMNEPLLVRMADMLEASGLLDKLILVVSPGQVDKMREVFAGKEYANKLEVAIQDPPEGTADAVAQAEPFVGTEDHYLVMNGDILAPLDEIIPKLIEHHTNLAAKCSMVVFPGEDERYGLLHITDDGKVLDIKEKEKGGSSDGKQRYINAGIYLFGKELFDTIRATPRSARGEYEITDTISILGKQGSIGAVITDSWMSTENPIDLFNAQLFFPPKEETLKMQFHSGGEIGFKVAEDIFFDKETEIDFSGVFFRGPVFLGKGTLIETGSKIGPRVYIGSDCEVGADSIIIETLMMSNTRVAAKCNISSAIIGEEVVIGANAKINGTEITKELLFEKRDRDRLEDFVIIGGKSILSTDVVINKGRKIDAHSAVKKGD